MTKIVGQDAAGGLRTWSGRNKIAFGVFEDSTTAVTFFNKAAHKAR